MKELKILLYRDWLEFKKKYLSYIFLWSLLPMMFYFRFDTSLVLNEVFIKFYLFLPAILMISNIPTYSLKGIKFEKKLLSFLIILLASFLSLLLTDFWLAMIIFIICYFSSIPFAIYEFKKT